MRRNCTRNCYCDHCSKYVQRTGRDYAEDQWYKKKDADLRYHNKGKYKKPARAI